MTTQSMKDRKNCLVYRRTQIMYLFYINVILFFFDIALNNDDSGVFTAKINGFCSETCAVAIKYCGILMKNFSLVTIT